MAALLSTNMRTAKSVVSTVGSLAAAAVVARSIINDFLPGELHDYLFSAVRSFFTHRFSSHMMTMIVEEFHGLENNRIFQAAELYLGSRTQSSTASSSPQHLKVSQPEAENAIQTRMDRNEEMVDEFEGVKFRWILRSHHVESKNYYNPQDMNSTLRSELRSFCLTFHKNAKDMALEKYLPHILNQAEFLKQASKTIKLFTADLANMYRGPGSGWSSINLNHPARFETLAMESEQKQMIIEDLERFTRRKEYYQRVGKAWKRGYLLYGPPGTGKSSLIAAMANYLRFDIYDLELSGLRSDSELRMLLLGTANRSILVVEDIDCSIELSDRNAEEAPPPRFPQERQVTLSGLLNCIDGLWSSCGNERIIIFTTNHKDKLDPALLRPGRMDMHIHMSYCTPCGFNILANNYLGLNQHHLFADIETLIEEVEISPAEVAEQLMKHDQTNAALEALLHFLNLKKIEQAEAMAKEVEAETNQPKPIDGAPNENDAQGEIAMEPSNK